MGKRSGVVVVMSVMLLCCSAGFASAQLESLDFVPAYNQYYGGTNYGCGPTAAAEIFGYWDQMGYPSLMAASGWNEIKETSNVLNDLSDLNEYCQTSSNGWTYLSKIDNGMSQYAFNRGYDFSVRNSSHLKNGGFNWADLTNEIDSGRPVMLLIDTDGRKNDGVYYVNHFVTMTAYNEFYDSNNQLQRKYGFYMGNREGENLYWSDFHQAGSTPYGVGYATFVTPQSAPVAPEPVSVILMVIGGVGLYMKKKAAFN